jgi:hypothetical protein
MTVRIRAEVNGTDNDFGVDNLCVREGTCCLINNNSFDTFVPSNAAGGGWTSSDINTSVGGWYSTGGNPTAYFLLNEVGTATLDPTLTQNVSGLVNGASYQVVGDYASIRLNNRPLNAVSFMVDVNPSNVIYSGLTTPIGQWTSFQSAIFTSVGTTNTLRLRGEVNGTDNDIVVDNICLRARPGCYANNGGFDLPVPNNWTGGGWTSSNINNSIGGWYASGGNPGGYFLLNDVGTTATDPTIQQTLSGLVAGSCYQIFGDYASIRLNQYPPNVQSMIVEVANTPSGPWTQVFGCTPTAIGSWTSFPGNAFTATSPTMTVRIRAEVNGTDNDFGIDNLCVQALARCCPADFDHDGFITGADFDLFVQAFESGEMTADFDGDGFLTGQDFDLYVQAFEAGC